MSVNYYKILTSTLPGGSGGTIMLPFKMDFFPVDNTELVEKQFVEKEIEKSINPIIDYEKIKFVPAFSGLSGTMINPQIPKIKIVFKKSNGAPLYYTDLGITNDDIKFLRSRFLNTFVNFSFFDNTLTTRNKIIFYSEFYTQIGGDQRDPITKLPLDVNSMPVTMTIYDPIKFKEKVSENYNIYWRKKDVVTNSKEIFMRCALKNASNGQVINYLSVFQPVAPPINSGNFYEDLYVKYTLKRDTDGICKYFIDNANRSITITPSLITINLYPVTVD